MRRWIFHEVDDLRNSPELPFRDLLDPATVQHALEENNVAFRDRIFTPSVTLWTFVSQVLGADLSCR